MVYTYTCFTNISGNGDIMQHTTDNVMYDSDKRHSYRQ
jgi:hypothetical protein